MTAQLPDTFRGSPTIGEPYIGYLRVSIWKEEKISPELQKAAIEAWAARTGRRIIDWIQDLDKTGRNFKRKIMRAIERVEAGEAKGIAVWKYNRFGRNDLGIAVNLARLEQVGGQLQSATEDIDASTAVGKFNRAILLDLAVFESDRAGEQWKETQDWRREHGLPATGRPRFGYIWHPRRIPDGAGGWTLQEESYQVDPPLAPTVKSMFTRYVAGEGFRALSESLRDSDHSTMRGTDWMANKVQRYMDSGFAAGLLHVHDPTCKCKNSRCKRYVYMPGAHEAIIDTDLWHRYLARRKTVKESAPRVRNAVYPLSGIVRCGTCRGGIGAVHYGRGDKRVRGGGYQCTRYTKGGKSMCPGCWIRRATVEEKLLEWLAREAAQGIDTAPSVPQQRPSVQNERRRAARERARLQGEHQQYADALKRLVMDVAMYPDKYPAGAFEAARDELTARQENVAAQIARTQEIEDQPVAEDFRPLMVGVMEEWEVLLPAEANALLRQLLRRVVINRTGRGTATFEFHPVWHPDPWAAQGQESDDGAVTLAS